MAGSSVLKRHTDEIALPPDHAALANGVKFVEAQFEIRRQQIEAMKLNSGAGIGDILNTASEDTALGIKEQQRVFRDRGPCDRSAFEFHRSYQQFTPLGQRLAKYAQPATSFGLLRKQSILVIAESRVSPERSARPGGAVAA